MEQPLPRSLFVFLNEKRQTRSAVFGGTGIGERLRIRSIVTGNDYAGTEEEAYRMKDMDAIQHEAYERLYGERLEEVHCDGLVLRHKKTGARIVLCSCEEENKAFAITFRTPPKDSTGVAHIIEHSVLCGSAKYPLKDPFMELAKGSLQTYLNAWTYPDKTVYPLSSCNDADFRNLVDVYMDAVLHPNIYNNEMIFRQEGWRYELDNREDPITLNGVVYSEMKGIFSNPEGILSRYTMNALSPDNTYGVVSGGNPEDIPKLTYEQFLDFHRTYYHPSNSIIYLYGNMDMADYLDYLDREYLSRYEALAVDSAIAPQQPYGVRETSYEYGISDDESEENKTFLAWGTLFENADADRRTAWEMIQEILFEMPGAPVRQALLDAGIGTDLDTICNTEALQPSFVLFAKGAEASQKEQFYEIIERECAKLANEGINRKSLRGTIASLEFSIRENDNDSNSTGLNLLSNVLAGMLYDDSQAFAMCKPFESVRRLREYLDTDYYEKLLREVMLSHRHELHMTGVPKHGLIQAQEAKLREEMAAYKASLSEEELDRLIDANKALRKYQETPDSPEALQTIPVLRISDIRRDVRKRPLRKYEVEGVPVLHYNACTHGITYMTIYQDITDMPEEELLYLGLYEVLLLRMDTTKHSYSDLNDEISLHVGAMYSDAETFSTVGNYRAFTGASTHCVKMLQEELPTALSLFSEMICDTVFTDKKRMLEVIQECVTYSRSGFLSRGNQTAKNRGLSYIQEADEFLQKTRDIDFYEFLADTAEHFEERADEIIAHLKGIVKYTVDLKRFTVGVTSDEAGMADVLKELPGFLKGLHVPEDAVAPKPMDRLPWEGGYSLERKNEAYTYGGKVNYVARCGNYLAHGFEPHGSMQVLRQIMNHDYLWQNLRVKGGAYGCGLSIADTTGGVAFYSYRDPNIRETNRVYEEAADYVRTLELDERELTKYVIGTISTADRPMSVSLDGEYAFSAYFTGVTEEIRQRHRNQILDVTVGQLREKADMLAAVLADGVVCCVGGEEAVRRDADVFKTVKGFR